MLLEREGGGRARANERRAKREGHRAAKKKSEEKLVALDKQTSVPLLDRWLGGGRGADTAVPTAAMGAKSNSQRQLFAKLASERVLDRDRQAGLE